MITNNVFGIDLGTSTISIYNHGKKSIMTEKNMIAIENKKNVFAYGNSAFEMYEKSPDNIVVSYPLSNGVIADINNMKTLLNYFIKDSSGGNFKGSDYFVAVPTDVTEVEKKAFFDLVKESGLKPHKIMIVEKAVADGIGLGIDVKSSQGAMVLDIGYNTTEISILSLGGIVLSKLIKTGGLKFDDAIRTAVRKEYNLLIGYKTAEKVKMELETLKLEGKPAVIYGRDVVSGLPMEREISTALIDECLKEHFSYIVDYVKVILERTPPELSADIYRNGLYLTGGGSLVSGLSAALAYGTGLKVNHADFAYETVAMGISEIIKDKKLRSLAYTIEGMGR